MSQQVATRRRIWSILIGTGLGAIFVVLFAIWYLLRVQSLPPVPVNSVVDNATTINAGLPDPVATVNGVAISRHLLETEIKISRLNLVEPLPPLTGEDLTRVQEEALNQLVTRQLILQAAARENFSLDETFIQQRAELLFSQANDERLVQALNNVNASYDDLLWWVSELATVEEFTVQIVMGNAAPEERQAVYNTWLNTQQANSDVQIFLGKESRSFTALPGNPAPEFTLSTPDGQSISLSDYQGQVVLVNFWATWCPSCVAEMPDYEAVYQRNNPASEKFVVLGVNLQENPNRVQEFAAGLGVTFPVLLDTSGDVTIKNYQMIGMPGSVIVNRQGMIFYRHIGPMSGALLTEKLAELEGES